MFSYVASQILLDLEKIDVEANTLAPVAILEMSTMLKDLDDFGVLRYVDGPRAAVGDAYAQCN